MAIFRTLFVLSVLLFSAGNLFAQTTWYVRDGGGGLGNGTSVANAAAQIGDIAGPIADGDVIDIGEGVFAGATLLADVHIAGADAGNAGAWGAGVTELGTIYLGGADQTVTIEGVRWTYNTVPVEQYFGGTNLVVTITNCQFYAAAPINATKAGGWNELYISDSEFDGNDGANGAVDNAVIANGLDILNVTENSFTEYDRAALVVTAGVATSNYITYNDFTLNNGDVSEPDHENDAAVTFASVATLTVAEIHNNRFTDDRNCVVTTGAISANLTVRFNRLEVFSASGSYKSVKNLGTGNLTATCNAYGANTVGSTVRSRVSGTVTVLPYNYVGTDNLATVGFEPLAVERCDAEGPVKTTTTEAAGTSYFTIGEAITASASGATVKIAPDVYTENLSITKSLSLLCWGNTDGNATVVDWDQRVVDTSDARVRSEASMIDLRGSITITSGAREVTLGGFLVTRGLGSYNAVTTSALNLTKITGCLFRMDPNAHTTSSIGAIHQARSGALDIQKSIIDRNEGNQRIRAVTFAAGNGARSIEIHDCNIEGTVQISGLSALASVDIRGCQIIDGCIDGISVTGNYVRDLNIEANSITDANENGIAFRNGAAIGTNSGTVTRNLITGSGRLSSSSSYAAINIGSATTGTQSFTDNSMHSQNGVAKNFINSRVGYNPVATCNWWGNVSEDVLLTTITDAGSIQYDNGTSGWQNVAPALSSPGVAAPAGTCLARTFTIALATTNIICNDGNDGTVSSTLAGNTGGADYLWSNTSTDPGITSLAANTYSLTVTTTGGNIRSKTATIYNPTAITATATPQNITCFTTTDGTITVTGTTGGNHTQAATRTYNWTLKQAITNTVISGPGTATSFTGLDAGTYDVYVTALASTNGTAINPACETMVQGGVVITRPALVTASIGSQTNVVCFGASTGTATAVGNGGVGSYGYSWNTSPVQTTATATGLSAGSYTVTVTDGNGCSTTQQVEITQPAAPVSVAVDGSTNVVCHGGATGAITITASGGTAPYTYTWTKSGSVGTYSSLEDISSLSAGTYTVVVNDANGSTGGCTATTTVEITQLPLLTASVSKENITCYSASDGTITVSSPNGGAGTYQASVDGTTWSTFVTSHTFSGLDAGIHVVRLRDAVNTSCVVTVGNSAGGTEVIYRPSQLNATVTPTHTTCSGNNDGVLTISSPMGGTHPELGTQTYEYNIRSSAGSYSGSNQTGLTFTDLAAGTYYIRVTAQTVSPTCEREIGPYEIFGSGSGITASVAHTNITCNGSVDGSITVTGTTGGSTQATPVRTYKHFWARQDAVTVPLQVSGSFTGLSAGTYTVWAVADADGQTPACSSVVGTVYIYEPSSVNSTVSKIHISKNGLEDGEISFAAATGGVHTAIGSRSFDYRVVKNGGGYAQTNSTGSFTGLAAGTYSTYVIALESGPNPVCTTQVASQVILEPTVVNASIATTNIQCNGSTDGSQIVVSGASGGTHAEAISRTYTYRVTRNGGGYDQSNGGGTFIGLSAGTYTVAVIAVAAPTTVPACTTNVSTTTVIFEPTPVTASSITQKNPTCASGSNGAINVGGAAGGVHGAQGTRTYEYTIVKVAGGTTGPQAGTLFSGLDAGTYNVFVTALAVGNNPACQTNVGQVVLSNPATITHSISDNADTVSPYKRAGSVVTLTVNVQGGHPKASSPFYNYTWTRPATTVDPGLVSAVNNGGGSYTLTFEIGATETANADNVTGSYSITVTDDSTCISTSNPQSTYVNVYENNELYVDNVAGSHATGTGSFQRPLMSVTKANDIAITGETINILQNLSGGTPDLAPICEGDNGPVITKNVTIKRYAFVGGSPNSGLSQIFAEPVFCASKSFVLGTSAVQFNGFTPSALFVNTDGSIQFAIDTVTSVGTVTLLPGTWNITSPLTTSDAITLQGSPTNLSTAACDMAPTSLLRAAGLTKLMIFSGSTTKTVRGLDLTVGQSGGVSPTTTGRFFEIPTGSSGNINTSGIIYRFDDDANPSTAQVRLFGITNPDLSSGTMNDVAKFINDGADAVGVGGGRVEFGNQGPLPTTGISVGWKAEDVGTAAALNGSQVQALNQMNPMDVPIVLNPGGAATRPLWRNPANGLGGRAGLFFDGINDYLSKGVSESVVSGAQKSVFAAFKTSNSDVASGAVQVIYKHGNHENGLSIVLIGTTSTTTESIRMTIYDNVGGTQRAVSKTFNNVAQNTVYIAQMYFDGTSTTQRVGMALDDNSGQIGGEQIWTDASFDVTTLTAPLLMDATFNISMGGRQGSARFSDVIPGTNGPTSASDFNTGAPSNFFGGAEARIGEVLVYNTAVKATRDAIYCYMRNKYLSSSGVNNNLEKGSSDDEDAIAGEFNTFADEVDLYPNPAESDVTINVAVRNAGQLKVDLVDALGRVVKTMFNDQASANFILPLSADVSNLANGTYVIRVTGAGNLSMSKPFIVRH